MATTTSIKVGGVWKDCTKVYFKTGGVWKDCDVYMKTGGVWKLVHSRVTFTPPAGSVSDIGASPSSVTITASESVTWTYSTTGSISASRASGTSGTSITFTTVGFGNTGSANVSANGQSWSVYLECL